MWNYHQPHAGKCGCDFKILIQSARLAGGQLYREPVPVPHITCGWVVVVFWPSAFIVSMDEKSTFPALILWHSLQFHEEDKCALSFVVHRLSLAGLIACLHATWGMLPLSRLITCPNPPKPALPIPKFSCAWFIHLSLCNEIPRALQAVAPHRGCYWAQTRRFLLHSYRWPR